MEVKEESNVYKHTEWKKIEQDTIGMNVISVLDKGRKKKRDKRLRHFGVAKTISVSISLVFVLQGSILKFLSNSMLFLKKKNIDL